MAAKPIAPFQSYLMLKIGVYYANQPTESDPSSFVTLEVARLWKREDRAFFIKHGTAVRLIGPLKEQTPEEKKSRWQPIPSGTMAIGFVNVLQLV